VTGRISVVIGGAVEINVQGTDVGWFELKYYALEGIPLLFHTESGKSRIPSPAHQWVTVVGYNRLCKKAIEVLAITEATPLFTETPTPIPTSSSRPAATASAP
jgi:hypothetical protein